MVSTSLTYSMEQSLSLEANWFAASQEILRVLWNPEVPHRTHKRPPPVPGFNFRFMKSLKRLEYYK
jgi:hypothetical protein